MAAMAASSQRNLLNWPEEIAAARAELLARADDLFAAILIAFGDEEGRRQWSGRLKRKRGRKPGKRTGPGKYQMFLPVYDALVAAGVAPEHAQALIVEWLENHPDSDFGNTKMVNKEALARGLDRAIKRREKEWRENPLTAWLSRDI
jgi:hypothetical protein